MALLRALPTSDHYQVTGEGRYDSAFAVTELANASVAAVGGALADVIEALNLAPKWPEVTVDQRLASLWFKYSFRAVGWEVPDLWDPIAGNYQTRDGWIRLHTNLPHHRDAALSVLGCAGNREAVAEAVLSWDRDALETAVVANGGVAAAMRSRAEWLAHPQGAAVAQEPLIDWVSPRHVQLRDRPEATLARPLAGLRVLDLTRVLAGPVSTRTLAGFGANVLRIDPPGWNEPGVLQDITLGKRMGVLDLKSRAGLDQLKDLVANADVLIHGYRPDALEALGFGTEVRNAIAPNRVEVTLDAYGWTGPWAKRRGFDSLVQMSAGISDSGRIWAGKEGPHPLPVQALDHATGYLMAAACLSAIATAEHGEPIATARLSLARTAETLAALPASAEGATLTAAEERDFTLSEQSGWGKAQRLTPPLTLSGCHMSWQHASGPVGRDPANW